MGVFVLLVLVVIAASERRVHSHGPRAAAQWLVQGAGNVTGDELVELRVFLRAERAHKLRELFVAVSNPRHASYGHFLDHAQLCSLVRPHQRRVAALREYLARHRIDELGTSRCGDVVHVQGTVRDIEAAWGASVVRAVPARPADRRPSILVSPRGLTNAPAAADIELIHGLHFPAAAARHSTRRSSANEADATPAMIAKLYGLPLEPAVNVTIAQAVVAFAEEDFSPSDLLAFQKQNNLTRMAVRNVYGDNTGAGDAESNLDVQWINSLGGVPTDFYLTPGLDLDVLAWLQVVLNQTASADVFSISYGASIDSFSVPYAQRCDGDFQRLALLGKTVLVASGDRGAYNDGNGDAQFTPQWPACSPSVTAIGATALWANLQEVATVSCTAYQWCSGGGFSFAEYFAANSTAPWTLNATSAYLKQPGIPNHEDTWWSEYGGVGFPDAAAVGTTHLYVHHGRSGRIYGTSASAPQFAAVISRLLHERVRRGLPKLGFLNPAIYSNPSMFKDIVLGNTGWPATPQWDATVGWGSPVWARMFAVFVG